MEAVGSPEAFGSKLAGRGSSRCAVSRDSRKHRRRLHLPNLERFHERRLGRGGGELFGHRAPRLLRLLQLAHALSLGRLHRLQVLDQRLRDCFALELARAPPRRQLVVKTAPSRAPPRPQLAVALRDGLVRVLVGAHGGAGEPRRVAPSCASAASRRAVSIARCLSAVSSSAASDRHVARSPRRPAVRADRQSLRAEVQSRDQGSRSASRPPRRSRSPRCLALARPTTPAVLATAAA